MIRECASTDFESIFLTINDAAEAYRGIVPEDLWHEPYMSHRALKHEIDDGVRFLGWFDGGTLVGVMGIQDSGEVALIRHAYVQTRRRRQGIGGKLLAHLRVLTDKSILIGTWAAATWAIDFYRKHGFEPVSDHEKTCLLRNHWDIPERQVETSVVLREIKEEK